MVENKEQVASSITVSIEDHQFVLSTDSPSLEPLVDFVVTHRGIDYSKIVVASSSNDFDIDSFKEALIDEITQLLKDIEINDDNLTKALASLPESNKN